MYSERDVVLNILGDGYITTSIIREEVFMHPKAPSEIYHQFIAGLLGVIKEHERNEKTQHQQWLYNHSTNSTICDIIRDLRYLQQRGMADYTSLQRELYNRGCATIAKDVIDRYTEKYININKSLSRIAKVKPLSDSQFALIASLENVINDANTLMTILIGRAHEIKMIIFRYEGNIRQGFNSDKKLQEIILKLNEVKSQSHNADYFINVPREIEKHASENNALNQNDEWFKCFLKSTIWEHNTPINKKKKRICSELFY